jgi:hypothetical protein
MGQTRKRSSAELRAKEHPRRGVEPAMTLRPLPPALAALVATLLAAPLTSAQAARASDDQHYVFPDDPLDAGFFGPNDVRIRVVLAPRRSTLIRPRVQFVDELLKSVEKL